MMCSVSSAGLMILTGTCSSPSRVGGAKSFAPVQDDAVGGDLERFDDAAFADVGLEGGAG
jgi:hypothetical protein